MTTVNHDGNDTKDYPSDALQKVADLANEYDALATQTNNTELTSLISQLRAVIDTEAKA